MKILGATLTWDINFDKNMFPKLLFIYVRHVHLHMFFFHFLRRHRKVYYPGESISGNVIISVIEDMVSVGISVEFSGRVKTCWVEGAGEEKKTHTGDQILFKKSKVLYFKYILEQPLHT